MAEKQDQVATAPEGQDPRSGSSGKSASSSRAGYIPISLERLPRGALAGIAVFLRTRGEDGTPDPMGDTFALYAAADVDFGEDKRKCLLEQGVRFVYLRIVDHQKFRTQVEAALVDAAQDPTRAVSERAALVYETSVELMNELLGETDFSAMGERLANISKAVTTLVMKDPTAFSHLLEASHHDFYTATHMVNVGTWMAPLAAAMGWDNQDELNRLVHAGLMHDIGKLDVPEEVLNKQGKLSDEEWAQIKAHPAHGHDRLKKAGIDDPIFLAVVRHHHERLDGTGYPDGLKADQIHQAAKICAVIDSFDAMTAFRPFKTKTMSPNDALRIIEAESPAKYDPEIVAAWKKLVGSIDKPFVAEEAAEGGAKGTVGHGAAGGGAKAKAGSELRAHERHSFSAPGWMQILMVRAGRSMEGPTAPITTHNLSRSGIGFLSREPLSPGDWVRVFVDRPGMTKRPLEGQVMRCRRYSDRWYDIGMQFASVSATAAAPAAAKGAA